MRHLRIMLACAALLLAVAGFSRAEQIRLADGRYIQGEVVANSVTEEGFTFRLTDTGGRVFLRWNQVDEALKKRLTNDRDPDEGLNTRVIVTGARLELIDGTVYEGNITESPAGYRVVNRENPRGRTIPLADVIEEGFVPDIEIDATVMHSEKEVLKLAEEERAPLENAIQYYELARIADWLGLYNEAKDLVTLALAAEPETRLESRLTEYDAALDELIRQQGVLNALVAARQQARSRQFPQAIATLNAAHEEFEPKDGVLARWQATMDEVDLDYTRHAISEWYKQMRPVTLEKARQAGLTISDAIAWARRDMDTAIATAVAESVGEGDPADVHARFGQRFGLEEEGKVRLSVQRASFGSDGFYQIVGGHLPIQGKRPAAEQPAPNRPRGPRGQPRNIDPRDIERIARGQDGGQDVSHLRVPAVVPTLQEWWEAAGASTRSRWLTAFYARYGGTMTVVDLKDWQVRFR